MIRWLTSRLAQSIMGRVVGMSRDQGGSRTVQQAIESAAHTGTQQARNCSTHQLLLTMLTRYMLYILGGVLILNSFQLQEQGVSRLVCTPLCFMVCKDRGAAAQAWEQTWLFMCVAQCTVLADWCLQALAWLACRQHRYWRSCSRTRLPS